MDKRLLKEIHAREHIIDVPWPLVVLLENRYKDVLMIEAF